MRRKSEGVSLTAQQQALVEQHLWLVEVIAQKVRKSLPSHADYEDLIQARSLGLIGAAQRYDGQTGTKFRSYAGHRIHGAMLDSLRGLDSAPRRLRKQQKNLSKATERLSARLQRTPNEAELAAELGCKVDGLRKLMRELHNLGAQSIDVGRLPEDRTMGSEPAAGADCRPDRLVEWADLHTLVESALAKLPRRQRTVVMLHDTREMRMREIGMSLGVSQSRISQMRRQALEQLKWELHCLGIRSTAAVC